MAQQKSGATKQFKKRWAAKAKARSRSKQPAKRPAKTALARPGDADLPLDGPGKMEEPTAGDLEACARESGEIADDETYNENESDLCQLR